LFVDGELLELAHALGQIGDPRAIVPLRQVFDRSPPTVQAAIVTAVCRLASPGETSWLVPLLRNHPAELSLAAAAGLKSVRDRRGARLVKQALRSEDEELRRQALGALAAFHGDREDVELVTCFVRDHGHPVDPQQPLELSSVEVLAQWCRLPFDEVRERFERLSRKIPLKLAWRKPRARRT
jgi:HEAT repeat protein